MWYRDSKKSLYVPKTEFDIQRRNGDERITAFTHIEAARHRYPQDSIIEVRVSGNHIEYMRIARDFGMDANSGPSAYSERCILKAKNDAEIAESHPSWWDLVQGAQAGKSTMSTNDAMRISSTLESISKLLAKASGELLRSNRIAETGWGAYVEAAKNMEPAPKVPQSYYDNLLKNGSDIVKNCMRNMSGIMIELQAHRHADESLSKAVWDAEQAMEWLAGADDEKNDPTFRGKMAVYASESIDNISWSLRVASRQKHKLN